MIKNHYFFFDLFFPHKVFLVAYSVFSVNDITIYEFSQNEFKFTVFNLDLLVPLWISSSSDNSPSPHPLDHLLKIVWSQGLDCVGLCNNFVQKESVILI